MKIKLTFIRSNFNLNPFPDRARAASYASRKDFDVYSIYRGRKCEQRFHLEAEKMTNPKIFEKVNFRAPEPSNSLFKFIFFIHLYL